MDKDVQIIALIIVGIMGIMASYTKQLDVVQVCAAGIIGFIGGKAVEIPNVPKIVYTEPISQGREVKKEDVDEMA